MKLKYLDTMCLYLHACVHKCVCMCMWYNNVCMCVYLLLNDGYYILVESLLHVRAPLLALLSKTMCSV